MNLFDNRKHAKTRQGLLAQLASWQTNTADPFADPAFLKRFSAAYEKNHQLWESLGGHKMKDNSALDFSEFIPPFDPAPYLGKKDP